MDKTMGICKGCMSPLERGAAVCHRCSYDNSIPNPRGTLPAGVILGGRYMTGRVMRVNDLTVTYLGLDTEKNVKVYIEEFYPIPLVMRDSDGCTVSVPDENRIRFKTLYSDIADRWKRLMKLDNRSVVKIRELTAGFGTICCVTEYLPYNTLDKRLEEQGIYNWSEAKSVFMPLFTLVANLHNQGLTHCGVSPDNILVNRRGELILTGFALPELRTEGSLLLPELYAGYSAPEQYSKNMWQGEWTDVYSLGAVLYRALTGVVPASAPDRVKRDVLPDAAAVEPSIPDNVSEALVRAMEPDKQKRFQSVNELTAALLRETTSNTAVFRPEPQSKSEPPKRADPKPTRVAVLGIILAISIVANIALGAFTLFTPVQEPPPEPESVVEPEPLPELMEHRLVGVYIKTVKDDPMRYGNLIYETEYAYNEEYPENIIFDQSVKHGEPVPENRTVKLYVSRGSQYLVMPYLTGSSVNFASKTLTDLNINYKFEYDYNPESEGIVGTVIDCDKGFGVRIARETELVTLTVKAVEDSPASSD